MAFKPVHYLEWAKSNYGAPYSLADSFAPPLLNSDLAELGVDQSQISHWPEPNSTITWTTLRELLASRHQLPESQLLPVASCSLANFLTFAAILNNTPRKTVLIESPTYTPLQSQISAAGGNVQSINVYSANHQLDLSELIRAINDSVCAIVLCNPHNPTGLIYDQNQLDELFNTAQKHGCTVVIDEVYREFIEPDDRSQFQRITQSQSNHPDTVITTTSLSKVHGLAQIKVGWIMGATKHLEQIQTIYDHLNVSIPFVCQSFGVGVLRNHWDAIIKRQRTFAIKRRNTVDQFFKDNPEHLIWHSPKFGVTGTIESRHSPIDQLIKHLRDKYETSLVPGHYFEMPGHARLGFAGDNLEEALRRLNQAAADLV